MDRLYPTSGGTKDGGGRKNKVPPTNSKRPKEATATPDARRLCDLPESKTDLLIAARRESNDQLTSILARPVQMTHQGV